MRTLTPEAARAIIARDTDQSILVLLSMTGPGMEPIRIVHNTESVTRNGQLYRPWGFDAPPPEDGAALATSVTLSIDNVDPTISRQIRDYQGVPRCEIVWVMSGQPDQAVYGPFDFVVKSAWPREMTIEVEVGNQTDILDQGFPGQRYTPTNSPGIYV